MNEKDRNKYILLGVLAVAAVGVVVYQATRKPDIPQMPPRPATSPAARQQPRAAQPGQASAFVQVDFDIGQLLASVQEVDFNYELEREARAPMTPIPGRSRADLITDDPRRGPDSPALAVARSMLITAIVYDAVDPMAVVENKAEQQVEVVAVGHEFPIGIIVESIEENRVVLRVGDMRIPKMLEEQ